MDYKNMWESLKDHYKRKMERLERQGREHDHVYLHAKATSKVMEYYELEEGNKKETHADLSIQDIREMAEEG